LQRTGNELTETRAYDLQGRLATWSIPGVLTRTYARDANGNVTAIEAVGYGYDALDRLVSEPGQTFAWDANGNRLGDARGAYTYTPESNRMQTAPTGPVTLDAAGNTLTLGAQTFGYDTTGRLAEVHAPGTPPVTFRYREDGLRSSRTRDGETTQFLYDPSGRLIAERSPTRARDWVWDDEGRPVAMLEGATITFLHADHLGTPRRGTNASGTVVWAWYGEAFGASASAIVALDVQQ